MFRFPINKKRFIAACIIGCISFIGDKNIENQSNKTAAAICDSLTHALVGVFTWIGTIANNPLKTDLYFIIEVFICAFFSSVIDADHFIAAKSLSLKDATSLKSRPFMHCTTLILFIIISVILFSYVFQLNWMYRFGWILTAAFLSHHIRDSKRRGFWLWPFGHTIPTQIVGSILQILLPYFLSVIFSGLSPPESVKTESIKPVEIV